MSNCPTVRSVLLTVWLRLVLNDLHHLGQHCEAVLTEYIVRRGFWVFRPLANYGPADLICINSYGDIVLLDSKSDNFRVNPGCTKPARIYRKRSSIQKLLNVRMAYVNAKTRTVYIKPPLD